MSYEIPKSRGVLPENRFNFHFAGSKKEWSVPLLQFIPPKIAAQLSDVDDEDLSSVMRLLSELFELIAPGKHLIDQFDDAEQMMAMFSAWQDESTVTLGESEASAES